MEHKFPLGRSNRENGTTFWAVPLFLGIFQSGEPKKRFPFSPEPEFSEFLTKWKAPMGQISVLCWAKNYRRKREFSKQSWLKSWCYYKDLYEINKMLLLLTEHGDPSFLFQNLSFYNMNNQLAKFEKDSQCRFYFSGITSTYTSVKRTEGRINNI